MFWKDQLNAMSKLTLYKDNNLFKANFSSLMQSSLIFTRKFSHCLQGFYILAKENKNIQILYILHLKNFNSTECPKGDYTKWLPNTFHPTINEVGASKLYGFGGLQWCPKYQRWQRWHLKIRKTKCLLHSASLWEKPSPNHTHLRINTSVLKQSKLYAFSTNLKFHRSLPSSNKY